jgi:hypothetical protein
LLKVNESTVTPGPPRETHSLYNISDFDVEVGQEARHRGIQGRPNASSETPRTSLSEVHVVKGLAHADDLVTLICRRKRFCLSGHVQLLLANDPVPNPPGD